MLPKSQAHQTSSKKSRVIRPTLRRRPHLHSHRSTRRREQNLIHPIIPLRERIDLRPRRRGLDRIDVISRGPALEIPTTDVAFQGLVVWVPVEAVELGAGDVAGGGAVLAEGGHLEGGEEAGHGGDEAGGGVEFVEGRQVFGRFGAEFEAVAVSGEGGVFAGGGVLEAETGGGGGGAGGRGGGACGGGA